MMLATGLPITCNVILIEVSMNADWITCYVCVRRSFTGWKLLTRSLDNVILISSSHSLVSSMWRNIHSSPAETRCRDVRHRWMQLFLSLIDSVSLNSARKNIKNFLSIENHLLWTITKWSITKFLFLFLSLWPFVGESAQRPGTPDGFLNTDELFRNQLSYSRPLSPSSDDYAH